jgi:TctA family transporter
MELINNLALGFSVALSFQNILFCLLGVFVGTLIGVLPGIGPVATLAMLLPITFNLEPVAALIMLAGIYYGAQYGGSTSAILVNLPGESSAVVTCLDGHQMAKQGRAGPALAIAALGSFFAGTVATLILATLAPPLAEVAFAFGPADYFSLMVLGLIAAVVLAHGSVVKAIAMILLGLLLGQVGTDVTSGIPRYSFDLPDLADGIDFAIVAMGMFGFGEIIANLDRHAQEGRVVVTKEVHGLWPSKEDFKKIWAPVLRGTALGSALGILPGGGAVLSSFGSYTIEKKLAKDPSQFGKGAPQGLAGPESANNAAAQTSFIPLLTLGIPPNAVMALMVGAMTIHGIIPGPNVMTERPELFWGMIASMWVGNLLLVVLNLPLIGIWIRLLTVPYRLLFPAILVFCCIGVYSLKNNPFDVVLTAGFGFLGYLFVKLGCEAAPLLLGFVLGPMMEENLRRAMTLSRGDPAVFFTRPISLGLLIAAGLLLVMVFLPAIRKKRDEAFVEEEEFTEPYPHPGGHTPMPTVEQKAERMT